MSDALSLQRAVGRVGWFGLLDTRTDTWLGDDTGPTTFENRIIAQVAAQMAAVQLGWTEERVRVGEYRGGATQQRDSRKIRRSARRALQILEGER